MSGLSRWLLNPAARQQKNPPQASAVQANAPLVGLQRWNLNPPTAPDNGVPADQDSKRLPTCAQAFLKPRIASDPADITLHDNGALWNHFDNSVTYGNDVYLAGDLYKRVDANAMKDKFHEIAHTSQNARLQLSAFDHAMAYLMFGGHDASPLEMAADSFATKTYEAYKKAGLDKKCPF